MLCSGLNGIAGAGGWGEPAAVHERDAGTGPGAADGCQHLGCSRGGSAPAAAHLGPLTRNGSSGVGSVGAPRAGGHPCRSRVSRAWEQGRSRQRFLGRAGGCTLLPTLWRPGTRLLWGSRQDAWPGSLVRSPPAVPQSRQEARPLEGAHEGAEQLGCRHEHL